eukprot:CAMPEP_0205915350 /NCGR_PEP_ID=MMETSP1325-20131115/7807_1 /ASSEMBLY_ACC=CAM_ASM_000708 /TAXON_ID=236786 /ORGANISM="Florenciella sp., Strain RCC1007" /LENGTH=48 /DNA_ID= /DNA_START= /DNA_END= /DNA_ORIENTATION=
MRQVAVQLGDPLQIQPAQQTPSITHDTLPSRHGLRRQPTASPAPLVAT